MKNNLSVNRYSPSPISFTYGTIARYLATNTRIMDARFSIVSLSSADASSLRVCQTDGNGADMR
jgi:hypothetical protein